ncbi:MAG TPA: HPr-rel-A system PqqD family peptide chaperone [Casimicrobiaceae bacterium]|jgi:PqqD family protein of HPr-rel-A system
MPEARNERASPDSSRWCVPGGQHFAFADFDDGIVMFDARVGATHLLNATAAEVLSIVHESSGLGTAEIYRMLLVRLELGEQALPFDAVVDLMWQLENLGLVTTIV